MTIQLITRIFGSTENFSSGFVTHFKFKLYDGLLNNLITRRWKMQMVDNTCK